jgi:hypothetical protein
VLNSNPKSNINVSFPLEGKLKRKCFVVSSGLQRMEYPYRTMFCGLCSVVARNVSYCISRLEKQYHA